MPDHPPRLLRLPEVMRRTGLSRATIYRMIAAGEFPPSVQLSARSVAWSEAAVNDWIEVKFAAAAPARAEAPTRAEFDPLDAAKAIHGRKLLTSDQIAKKAQPWQPKCGIYFLLLDGAVQYVGQSINVDARITQHCRSGKVFDSWHWEACDSDELDTRETLYIHALRPPLNLYESGKYAGDVCVPVGMNKLLALQREIEP